MWVTKFLILICVYYHFEAPAKTLHLILQLRLGQNFIFSDMRVRFNVHIKNLLCKGAEIMMLCNLREISKLTKKLDKVKFHSFFRSFIWSNYKLFRNALWVRFVIRGKKFCELKKMKDLVNYCCFIILG